MKYPTLFIKVKKLAIIGLILMAYSCGSKQTAEVNIGYIGPLTVRATDLGIGPSKAMELAVEQYNANRLENEPKVNFFIEDDQWEKDRAIPAYKKLRKEHDIDILFISNTDGTVAVQDLVLADDVILINPLNNDELLSSLNKNTFKIAKSTEDAMGLVALRIIQLDLKKVVIMQYPNDFMMRGALAAKKILDEAGIENKIVEVEKGNEDFSEQLTSYKADGYDAYVFFGYKEFGFAMKQARDMGITAAFFGGPPLLDPQYFTNSEGAIIGTEFPFFTPKDGNYVLAQSFLIDYENKFNEELYSFWPGMQAYDAMSLTLNEIKNVNRTKNESEKLVDWLRASLLKVNHFQGVCGNLMINEDGSSRGIYFSLYQYVSEGKCEIVK